MAMAKAPKKIKEDVSRTTGVEKAAIVLLALGEEHGSQLLKLMDEEEIKELSQVMSTLGTVSSALVDRVLIDFVSQMSATGSIMGSFDATERLLSSFLDPSTASARSWKRFAAQPAARCGTSSPM